MKKLLIVALTLLMSGCFFKEKTQEEWDNMRNYSVEIPKKQVSEIKLVSSAVIDSALLQVFEDSKTGARILYYREAMVVLPKQ